MEFVIIAEEQEEDIIFVILKHLLINGIVLMIQM